MGAVPISNMIDPSGKWRMHGNWCGRRWTGGYDKYFEEMTDKEKKNLAPPLSRWDRCCMEHDYCYFKCREERRKGLLNWTEYKACLYFCDLQLKWCWWIFVPQGIVKRVQMYGFTLLMRKYQMFC